MDDTLKNQLEEVKKLKGAEKEQQLLLFAEEHQSPQAYNELGIYYRETGEDLSKAIEMFEKALAIQEDAAVYSNLASTYFTLAQQPTPQQKYYMKKTEEAFKSSANLNSASYYFLGNLYMPKVNAPFPDDQEKAISYFMKIEKDKTYFWGLAMKNIGLYYYHVKKDYLRSSAFLKLAKEANPKDKKVANYFEYSFGKVNGRKFWKNQYAKINDQHDVDKVVEEGKYALTLRCPRCGSVRCTRISVFTKMKMTLSFSIGTRRFERYAKKYHCDSCKNEW